MFNTLGRGLFPPKVWEKGPKTTLRYANQTTSDSTLIAKCIVFQLGTKDYTKYFPMNNVMKHDFIIRNPFWTKYTPYKVENFAITQSDGNKFELTNQSNPSATTRDTNNPEKHKMH